MNIGKRAVGLLMLPPALALSVFGYQIYCVGAHEQSRWKGGGMGMFSSMSTPRNRFATIYGLIGDERLPIEIPPVLAHQLGDLLSKPTDKLADPVFRNLRSTEWRGIRVFPLEFINDRGSSFQNSTHTTLEEVSTPGPGRRHTIQPERFIVEVRQVTYDRRSGIAGSKKIREFIR